ncbi:MAG: malectin domain-containing carbohydrate-binding protein [Actinomycetota bacterium]
MLLASLLGAPGPAAEAAFAQGIDAGAAAPYTDLSGNPWAADQAYAPGGFGFVGGSTFSTTAEIGGTGDDPLYRTYRSAPSFEYRLDLASETYSVLLRFAEIDSRFFAVGRRVFNVAIEGVQVLSGFDIFATAGANAALDRTFEVAVTDGTMNIVFSRTQGRAVVNAIAVESATSTPDFTFAASPATVTTAPGGTATFTAEVAFVNGFTSTNTDLWVTGLPAGATGVYAPDPLTHEGMSQLTITSTATIPTGTYPLVLGATAEGITHSQDVTLVVSSTPDFSIAISPTTQSIASGGSGAYQVTLTALNGFRRIVTLSVSGLPPGAAASFSPNSVRPPATSTMTITANPGVAEAEYPLVVTGTSGPRSRSVPASLLVSGSVEAWRTAIAGSTGVANNSLIMGPGRSDGVNRIYAGTVNTGRVMELSWNGTSWASPVDVGGSPAGLEIHNLGMGPGRNDGRTRIYACSLDENLYELTYVGPGWTQATVGAPDGVCTHAVVGDGRNDGVNRLYATRGQVVWEYTWNGGGWDAVQVGSVSGGIVHGIDLGPGRGGSENHVYIASSARGTFEATFSGGTWSMTSMGDDRDVRNVAMGPGRDDGVMRVYAGVSSGEIREFTWNGSSWSMVPIDTGIADVLVHAYVVAGRNDGVMRLYGAAGDGSAYEFTWDGSGWTRLEMGGGSAYMYGFAPGGRPGDALNRLFGAAFDGGVYEFTWN